MSLIWQETVAKNPPPELLAINRLALARIRELCNAIERDYGLHVKTGAELEFYTLDDQGRLSLLPAEDDIEKISRDFSKYPGRPGMRGTHIERIYEEADKPAKEYVIGWHPLNHAGSAEEDLKYRHPTRIAQALDGLRHMISRPEISKRHNVDKVAFSRYPERLHTAAQQISVSLLDAHGVNYLVHKNVSLDPNALMLAAADGMIQIQKQTLLLATNYPFAHEELVKGCRRRFSVWNWDKTIFRRTSSLAFRQVKDSDTETLLDEYRIENLLPRAAGNPYLAVLQTVAGLYRGLRKNTCLLMPEDTVPEGHDVITLPDGRRLAAKPIPLFKEAEALPDFETSHQQFCDSDMAKDLCGTELHGLISRFYSKEAILERERGMKATAALAASTGR